MPLVPLRQELLNELREVLPRIMLEINDAAPGGRMLSYHAARSQIGSMDK
jgi:hypothetical protein